MDFTPAQIEQRHYIPSSANFQFLKWGADSICPNGKKGWRWLFLLDYSRILSDLVIRDPVLRDPVIRDSVHSDHHLAHCFTLCQYLQCGNSIAQRKRLRDVWSQLALTPPIRQYTHSVTKLVGKVCSPGAEYHSHCLRLSQQ